MQIAKSHLLCMPSPPLIATHTNGPMRLGYCSVLNSFSVTNNTDIYCSNNQKQVVRSSTLLTHGDLTMLNNIVLTILLKHDHLTMLNNIVPTILLKHDHLTMLNNIVLTTINNVVLSILSTPVPTATQQYCSIVNSEQC